MIGSLLLLLAATPPALGTSPLVESDHSHRWIDFQDDAEGTGWIDEAWRSQTVIDGRPVQLMLMRAVIISPEAMTVDFVLAVDCERDLIGIQQGWMHSSGFGNNMRLPIQEVTMDFAKTPPSPEDQKVVAFACSAERAN